MPEGSTRAFYDGLAPEYDRIYGDWPASIRRQAEALNAVIRDALGAGPHRILDCTCGIGTQALGLAELGHRVTGSDLSPGAIRRAGEEAGARGLSIAFHVVDLLDLGDQVGAGFDVVLSADNALPHLLSEADLRRGVRNMVSRLRPGGLFLASTRDYDRILEEKPEGTGPGMTGPPGNRRASFQLWEWEPDGRTYRVQLFFLDEEEGGWRTRCHTARYRGVRREELSGLLGEAGIMAPRWLEPEHTGFFQPMVVGRRLETLK